MNLAHQGHAKATNMSLFTTAKNAQARQTRSAMVVNPTMGPAYSEGHPLAYHWRTQPRGTPQLSTMT